MRFSFRAVLALIELAVAKPMDINIRSNFTAGSPPVITLPEEVRTFVLELSPLFVRVAVAAAIAGLVWVTQESIAQCAGWTCRCWHRAHRPANDDQHSNLVNGLLLHNYQISQLHVADTPLSSGKSTPQRLRSVDGPSSSSHYASQHPIAAKHSRHARYPTSRPASVHELSEVSRHSSRYAHNTQIVAAQGRDNSSIMDVRQPLAASFVSIALGENV